MKLNQINLNREGKSQYWYGNNKNKIIILNQFNDKFNDVVGSKIEKIFVIIFNFI